MNEEQKPHKTWVMLKKGKRFVPCEPPTGLNESYLRIALDGRYNAEGGHDPFTNRWYDHKTKAPLATRHDYNVLKDVEFNPANWTEQGYRFDGTSGIYFDKESACSSTSGEFMVEIMFEPDEKNSGTLLSFGFYNNGVYGTSTLDSYAANASNRKYTFEFRLNGKKIEYYKNGQLVSSKEARYLRVTSWVTWDKNNKYTTRIRADIETGSFVGSTIIHQCTGSGSVIHPRNLRIGYNQSGANYLTGVVNSIRLHKFSSQSSDYGAVSGIGDHPNGGITQINQSAMLAERFPIK